MPDRGKLIEFDTLTSTSDWLALNAPQLIDPTWVRATSQTAGHGRHGRPWQSPPGNLAASVLIRARPGEGPPQQLSFVAALALSDAVSPWAGRLRLSLKWPNDLVLAGGKVAGILLEQNGDATIIGFGVNLAHAPKGVDQRTAALTLATPHPPRPAALLEDLRSAFATWRDRWRREGFAPIRTAWQSRATPVGWRTSVKRGSETLAGAFAGLADDGAMLLKRDGRTETIHAGEVLGL